MIKSKVNSIKQLAASSLILASLIGGANAGCTKSVTVTVSGDSLGAKNPCPASSSVVKQLKVVYTQFGGSEVTSFTKDSDTLTLTGGGISLKSALWGHASCAWVDVTAAVASNTWACPARAHARQAPR